MRLIIALFWFAFISASTFAQQKPLANEIRITPEEMEEISVIDGYVEQQSFDLVYHPKGTDYSKPFRVSGTVEEQSSAGFHCGTICHSGTMKVRVDGGEDAIPPMPHVYVLIPCFVHSDYHLGKPIELLISPLSEDRNIGCYANVVNSIDSKDTPFYYCHKYDILLKSHH